MSQIIENLLKNQFKDNKVYDPLINGLKKLDIDTIHGLNIDSSIFSILLEGAEKNEKLDSYFFVTKLKEEIRKYKENEINTKIQKAKERMMQIENGKIDLSGRITSFKIDYENYLSIEDFNNLSKSLENKDSVNILDISQSEISDVTFLQQFMDSFKNCKYIDLQFCRITTTHLPILEKIKKSHNNVILNICYTSAASIDSKSYFSTKIDNNAFWDNLIWIADDWLEGKNWVNCLGLDKNHEIVTHIYNIHKKFYENPNF